MIPRLPSFVWNYSDILDRNQTALFQLNFSVSPQTQVPSDFELSDWTLIQPFACAGLDFRIMTYMSSVFAFLRFLKVDFFFFFFKLDTFYGVNT
jgi:hypothetical protein